MPLYYMGYIPMLSLEIVILAPMPVSTVTSAKVSAR